MIGGRDRMIRVWKRLLERVVVDAQKHDDGRTSKIESQVGF